MKAVACGKTCRSALASAKLDNVELPWHCGQQGHGTGPAVAMGMALTATYAEPALNAMGLTTEQLTDGQFKKSPLQGRNLSEDPTWRRRYSEA